MQFGAALTSAGLRIVGTAVNGEEAVAIVLQERPDFVLMDINMPVLSGIDAVKAIMAEFRTRIVIITAYNDHEHLDAALSAGAVGYLTKPVTSHDIIDALVAANEFAPNELQTREFQPA
jgi:YesN/AraC family two-component response regulator